MSEILLYSGVELLSDNYKIAKGSCGYVIEIYNADSYEVEFSAADGSTIDTLVLKRTELQIIDN